MDDVSPADPPLDYEALFQDAPAGYAVTRENGTIAEANRTLLAWLGKAATNWSEPAS